GWRARAALVRLRFANGRGIGGDPRQQEVAERPAVDADEQAVDLERGAEGGDRRAEVPLRPGRALGGQPRLVDPAVVEGRHREAPGAQPLDLEPRARTQV